REFKSAWYAPGTYSEFYRAIHDSMAPFVKTYDICGCFEECSYGMKNVCQQDRVYLLNLQTPFKYFVETVAFAALNAIKPLLETDSVPKAFEQLRSVFRMILGSHINANPLCKNIELCAISTEKDAWVEKEPQLAHSATT